MKHSTFVAILALCLVYGVARSADPVGFAFLPYTYCRFQFITYEAGGYRSQGTCEVPPMQLDYSNKNLPWSAFGSYDASTREANESFDVGISVADNNYYYGTIESRMSCDKDPWLDNVKDCRVESVSTSGNIPRDLVDGVLRKRGHPLTSDLTPDQRATLQREYHARHYDHGATPAQAAHVEREIPRLADTDTSTTPFLPTTPLIGRAQSQPQNRMPMAPQPIEILEPAPGSQQVRGNVRVRVRGGAYAVNPNVAMVVELSPLPPRPTQPGNPPHPSAQGSKTTQASLAQLQQGVLLPGDVAGAWTGPTLIRVRAAQSSTWSNGVSFDLVAGNAGVAARPALPAWSALQSTAPPAAGRPAVATPPTVRNASPLQVPRSAFGGGQ